MIRIWGHPYRDLRRKQSGAFTAANVRAPETLLSERDQVPLLIARECVTFYRIWWETLRTFVPLRAGDGRIGEKNILVLDLRMSLSILSIQAKRLADQLEQESVTDWQLS